jgi:hypothetical protein
VHSILRYNATFFPAFRRLSAHGARTRGNYHPAEGSWRVQLRRKGKYVNETFLRRKEAGNRERFIKFGKARALEGAGAVTVGIDPGYIKKDDSIALSWHWKQTFGSRFPLVVSSDLLSRRQCGRTKSQELNGATSTPAAACSSFEIGRILERRRATTSEFPCWMYQVVVRKPAWDDHGVVASGARFSRTDIADRIFARRWILLPTHASRLPKLSRLRSRIWRAPENPSIPWTWN